MDKHFYIHILDLRALHDELNKLEITHEEKKDLLLIIDSSIHHAIIDVVLTELPEDDKHIFLTHLAQNDHKSIWTLLNKKVENIEDKISHAVNSLKNDLIKDIKKLKNNK